MKNESGMCYNWHWSHLGRYTNTLAELKSIIFWQFCNASFIRLFNITDFSFIWQNSKLGMLQNHNFQIPWLSLTFSWQIFYFPWSFYILFLVWKQPYPQEINNVTAKTILVLKLILKTFIGNSHIKFYKGSSTNIVRHT